MGFNPKYARPDWMVLTAFPVPPPTVRPSVMMDGVNRCRLTASAVSRTSIRVWTRQQQ